MRTAGRYYTGLQNYIPQVPPERPTNHGICPQLLEIRFDTQGRPDVRGQNPVMTAPNEIEFNASSRPCAIQYQLTRNPKTCKWEQLYFPGNVIDYDGFICPHWDSALRWFTFGKIVGTSLVNGKDYQEVRTRAE